MSEMTMWPMYVPSAATCTMVPLFSHSCQSTPTYCISLPLPTATFLPSTVAITPLPDSSSTSEMRLSSSGMPKARLSEAEMGWVE